MIMMEDDSIIFTDWLCDQDYLITNDYLDYCCIVDDDNDWFMIIIDGGFGWW